MYTAGGKEKKALDNQLDREDSQQPKAKLQTNLHLANKLKNLKGVLVAVDGHENAPTRRIKLCECKSACAI